jgi:hypothetical protein
VQCRDQWVSRPGGDGVGQRWREFLHSTDRYYACNLRCQRGLSQADVAKRRRRHTCRRQARPARCVHVCCLWFPEQHRYSGQRSADLPSLCHAGKFLRLQQSGLHHLPGKWRYLGCFADDGRSYGSHRSKDRQRAGLGESCLLQSRREGKLRDVQLEHGEGRELVHLL